MKPGLRVHDRQTLHQGAAALARKVDSHSCRIKSKEKMFDSLLFQKKHRIWGEKCIFTRMQNPRKKISLISVVVLGVGFSHVLYVHMCQRTTFVS